MKVKDIEGNLDKRELSFILSTDKIVSVNQLYNARVGRKGGIRSEELACAYLTRCHLFYGKHDSGNGAAE